MAGDTNTQSVRERRPCFLTVEFEASASKTLR
jgi:hypothetical protein